MKNDPDADINVKPPVAIPEMLPDGSTKLKYKDLPMCEGGSIIPKWARDRLVAFIRKGANFSQASALARRIMKKSLVEADYLYLKGFADLQEKYEKMVMISLCRLRAPVVPGGKKEWVSITYTCDEKGLYSYFYSIMSTLPSLVNVEMSKGYADGVGNVKMAARAIVNCPRERIWEQVQNVLGELHAIIRKDKQTSEPSLPHAKNHKIRRR